MYQQLRGNCPGPRDMCPPHQTEPDCFPEALEPSRSRPLLLRVLRLFQSLKMRKHFPLYLFLFFTYFVKTSLFRPILGHSPAERKVQMPPPRTQPPP